MAEFAASLIAWFEHSGRRDLPWQTDRNPYRVWVSEIMLQQTQVATVIPYFMRFMERFPSVEARARADLDDVLAVWSGLGYYARARNLHRAAKLVFDKQKGTFPTSIEGLMDLPGVGRSTAGAILSLSCDKRAPILDGNVKRVLARYHAVQGWPGHARVSKRLWSLAERHTPKDRVADYTQAIMDLGATLCVRKRPLCEQCPVSVGCKARIAGLQDSVPGARPRREKPRREVHMLLVRDPDRRVLLAKRPPSGIWGGLYSLPELADDEDPRLWCDRHLGALVDRQTALDKVEHSFTHFDLSIRPLLIRLATLPRSLMDRKEWLWYNPAHDIEVGVAAPVAALLKTLRTEEEISQ